MRYLLVLLAALFIVGCNTMTVPTFDNVKIHDVDKLNKKKIKKAITEAAEKRKWRVKAVKDGELELTLRSRSHVVKLTALYTNKDYSLRYKDSENMKYNAENNTIHKKYTRWVRILVRDIQRIIK